ncbi:MAG TPA: pseudaminic acid synthase [Vicinamibacterales bacterium]|nr:pseudaminic acid synthase [Vicinamibacterales bacterium]
MATGSFRIGRREVGDGHPTFIVAELSANHGCSLERAKRIVEAAAQSGADAIKVQTYTADTVTVDSDNEHFRIKGTVWDGRTLYDLYNEAHLPWEWHAPLQRVALDLGLEFFSTPFDATSVDFLVSLNVPAWKIASFEMVDLPLIRKVAGTGQPLIMSTGMATRAEIAEAVAAATPGGSGPLVLLKCTSSYPAEPEDMHLRTIPDMAAHFGVPVGLSDHTMGIAVPVAAVALGACVIEKHLTMSRDEPGPDSAFSLEPAEFRAMVDAVRIAERAAGSVSYDVSASEAASRGFRRSLFVVQDMKVGDQFSPQTVRSIRPAAGLHTRHLDEVLGRLAARDIRKGTPLSWDLLQ